MQMQETSVQELLTHNMANNRSDPMVSQRVRISPNTSSVPISTAPVYTNAILSTVRAANVEDGPPISPTFLSSSSTKSEDSRLILSQLLAPDTSIEDSVTLITGGFKKRHKLCPNSEEILLSIATTNSTLKCLSKDCQPLIKLEGSPHSTNTETVLPVATGSTQLPLHQ